MRWLPSTKTRYLLLAVSLLALLAVLDAMARAVAGFEGLGLALIVWACFGVVYGWIALEPAIHTRMLVGRVETGSLVDRVNRIAAEVARNCGTPAPAVCLYDSSKFDVVTMGMGKHSTIFMANAVADLKEEDLRAVIAHEYGHVVLRHPVARLGLYGSLLALAMLSNGTPFVALGANLFVLWCMRQMEYRADGVAATLVGAASVRSALGAARDVLGEMPRWLSVFNTHPLFADRIKNLT